MAFKIKEGDVIFCSSKLTWKSLLLFPARFLIQLTTLSKYEHAAQFINGKVAEANSKKGTILTPLQKWLDSRYDFVTIDILRPRKITEKQLGQILPDHTNSRLANGKGHGHRLRLPQQPSLPHRDRREGRKRHLGLV